MGSITNLLGSGSGDGSASGAAGRCEFAAKATPTNGLIAGAAGETARGTNDRTLPRAASAAARSVAGV